MDKDAPGDGTKKGKTAKDEDDEDEENPDASFEMPSKLVHSCVAAPSDARKSQYLSTK